MALKKTISIITMILIFGWDTATAEEYQVIPHPQSISYEYGSLMLEKSAKLFYSPSLKKVADNLKNSLQADLGLQLESTRSRKRASIILEINPQVTIEGDEGYLLKVGRKSITIISKSEKGIFYGTQTLRQVIKRNATGYYAQLGTITDYPAFSWRSFMLDEGRYFKGKEVVKQLLDEMALLKFNVFHWHLVDDQGWRIEIKKYPLLTQVGSYRDSTEIGNFHSNKFDGKPHSGYYTQDDIREIVSYAAERHIMIVPEIEMPGHSSAAIASYPWLGTSGQPIKVPCKFGVQYDIFNVAEPRVIQFFSDVFDEVISLFPSPVIHIGGDEPRYDQWNASSQIKAYMAQNNLKTPSELLVFFTNNISKMLENKGKRMMGWNEITGAKLHHFQSDEDTKGMSQRLAESAIVQYWTGETAQIVNTIKSGYEVVNSFSGFTYLDYNYKTIPLTKAYSFNPIPSGLTKEMEAKVLGMGCQMWGEFIPTVESMNKMVYPRLAAYSECGWTKNELKNYDRFKKVLPRLLDRWSSKGIAFGPTE